MEITTKALQELYALGETANPILDAISVGLDEGVETVVLNADAAEAVLAYTAGLALVLAGYVLRDATGDFS